MQNTNVGARTHTHTHTHTNTHPHTHTKNNLITPRKWPSRLAIYTETYIWINL